MRNQDKSKANQTPDRKSELQREGTGLWEGRHLSSISICLSFKPLSVAPQVQTVGPLTPEAIIGIECQFIFVSQVSSSREFADTYN